MVYQLTSDGSRSQIENEIGYAGYISNDSGKILFVFYEHRNKKKHRVDTNLFEYYGLLHGLESALMMGVRDIACYNDSLNLIRDCIKYSNADYNELFDNKSKKYLIPLIEVIQQFDNISFHHLPRKQNQYCDYLSHIWRNKTPQSRKEFFNNFIRLGGDIEYDFFEMAKLDAISKQEQKNQEKQNNKIKISFK